MEGGVLLIQKIKLPNIKLKKGNKTAIVAGANLLLIHYNQQT